MASWRDGCSRHVGLAPGVGDQDTVLVTVHENDVDPEYPALSVAVTVTEDAPAVVGVPVIVPVDALMDSPVGRPVADPR